jgi:hypothetical protein
MSRELKLVAMLSAMLFILLGPTGVYLMSFQGEGLAGDVMGYAGKFILLPATILHRVLGPTWVSVVLGLVAQFAWFMLWVAAGRRYYLRKQKAA